MVSSFLAKLLQLDLEISEKIASLTICSSTGLIRTICLVVEWSMHGIPWLIGSVMAVIWSRLYANSCSTVCQYRISLLLLSILADLVVVGFLKILIRRERPLYNQDDQIYEAPIADKFSLPSGHSTRAAMLFVLFLKEHLSDQRFFNLLDLWFAIFVAIVAFSRVLMGRHFLSDVIIGILVGCIEAGILQSAFVKQKIFDRSYFLFI